jgi:exopolysaccharide production protein ExoQ
MLFMTLVFVGLRPLEIRDEGTLLAGATGDGDLARQIAYLIAFTASLGVGLFYRGTAAFTAIPGSLVIVLAWCFLSVAWAIEPAIAFRRASLTAAVVITLAVQMELLGPYRLLRALRAVLALLLVVNFAAVAVVPHAVHLPGERAADLIGAWRGVHFHKSIAGVIAAISALLFLWFAVETRRRQDWLLFGASMVFLVMTKAKTSIGLVALAVLSGYLYRRMLQRKAHGLPALLTATAIALVVAGVALFYQAELARLLDDPEFLTGRGAIWQVLVTAIEDHPVLGVGYGSFWAIGDATPVASFADSWIKQSAHGHNGYLDVMLQTGGVGLALVALFLILMPLKRLLCDAPRSVNLQVLCFSVLAFTVFFNFTESGFIERDRPEWVFFVIVLLILNHVNRDRTRPAAHVVANRATVGAQRPNGFRPLVRPRPPAGSVRSEPAPPGLSPLQTV